MERPAAIVSPEDLAHAFGVSRETLGRLETYEALLRHWQKSINLVAPSTLTEVWHRHFADSAQLLALAPSGTKGWLDLGFRLAALEEQPHCGAGKEGRG